MADREAADAIGVNHNRFRYAAPTGTVAIRWEGARAPTIWMVPAPDLDPTEASLELARRYLHVFGDHRRVVRRVGRRRDAAGSWFSTSRVDGAAHADRRRVGTRER
jgi:hypothetical protein